MSRLLSLAVVCVLAPAAGRAEDLTSPATPGSAGVQALVPQAAVTTPSPQGSAPASDVPLRQERPVAGDPPPSVSTRSEGETGKTVRRVLVETLIGGGGMVLGAVAGQALSPGGFSGSCSGCAPDYSAGFMLGAGLGSGLGVYGAGTLMGGDGDFLATMAGAGLGAGGAFLLLDAGDGQGRGNTNAFTALLMPLAGAIAGYEISNALSGLSVSPPPRWSRQAPRLVPVASATKDGGVLGGLAGRF